MMFYSCGIILRLLIKVNTIAWNKFVSMNSCISIFFNFRYRPYSCCHDRTWRHFEKNKLKDKNVRNNGLNTWTTGFHIIPFHKFMQKYLYIHRWYITNDFWQYLFSFGVLFKSVAVRRLWCGCRAICFISVQLKHKFYMCYIFKIKHA